MALGALRRLSVVVDVDDRASDDLARINASSSAAASGLSTVEKRAKLAKTALLGFGAGAAAGAVAIAGISKVGMELDSTFATIQATSRATDEEMQKLRETVTAIGTEAPVSIQQAAESAKQFSYAGFAVEEQMAALEDAVNLATASTMDMEQATKVTAQTLKAFGLEASQAGAVTSSMAATFASSNTELRDMGTALSYVAGTANQLGLTLAETNAAIGVLADSGLEAGRAGRMLNRSLLRLVDPTGKANDAMEQLGLSIEDFRNADGSFKSILEITKMLKQRMEELGLTSAEQGRVLKQLFGTRGMRAMSRLIGRTDELQQKIEDNLNAQIKEAASNFNGDVSDMAEHLRNKFGTSVDATAAIQDHLVKQFGMTQEAAKKFAGEITGTNVNLARMEQRIEDTTTAADIKQAKMETLGGTIKHLKGSLTTIANQMYQGFKPALLAVATVMKETAAFASSNETAMKLLGVALFGATTAFTAATAAAAGYLAKQWIVAALGTKVASATMAQTAAIYTYKGALAAASAAQFVMTASTSQLIAATWGYVTSAYAAATGSISLSGALATLRTAILATYAALGPVGWLILGISAAFVAWETNLFGFRDALQGVTSDLEDFYGFLEAHEGFLGDAIGAEFDKVGAFLRQHEGFLGDWLRKNLDGVGADITGWLKGAVSWAVSGTKQFLTKHEGFLGDWLRGAGDRMVTNAISTFTQAGQDTIDAFVSGLTARGHIVSEAIEKLMGDIKKFLPGSDADRGPLSGLTDSGAGMASAFASGIEDGQGDVEKAAHKMSETADEALKPQADTSSIDSVRQSLSSLRSKFSHSETTAKQTKTTLRQVKSALKNVSKEARKSGGRFDRVFGDLSDTLGDVTERWDGLMAATRGFVDMDFDLSGHTEWLETLWGWLGAAWQGAANLWNNLWDLSVFDLDLSQFKKPFEDLKGWIKGSIDKAVTLLEKLTAIDNTEVDPPIKPDHERPDQQSDDKDESPPGQQEGEDPSHVDEKRKQKAEEREQGNVTISKEAVQWLRNNMSKKTRRRLHRRNNVPFDERLPREVIAEEVRRQRQLNRWDGPKAKKDDEDDTDDDDDDDTSESRGGFPAGVNSGVNFAVGEVADAVVAPLRDTAQAAEQSASMAATTAPTSGTTTKRTTTTTTQPAVPQVTNDNTFNLTIEGGMAQGVTEQDLYRALDRFGADLQETTVNTMYDLMAMGLGSTSTSTYQSTDRFDSGGEQGDQQEDGAGDQQEDGAGDQQEDGSQDGSQDGDGGGGGGDGGGGGGDGSGDGTGSGQFPTEQH